MAEKTVEERRFFITVAGERTTLQYGDELCLLADNAPSNLLFTRGGYGLAIRSERGDPAILQIRRIFSRDEARLLAVGIAVGSGLAIQETEVKNPVFAGNNVSFRFV